jgi:hypothetical protein
MIRPGSDEEYEYITYLMKKYDKSKKKEDQPEKDKTD